MPIVSQSIPALYGGVSQQAAVSRSPVQLEDAVNCDFSIAHGVSKRPPLEIISNLTSSDWTDAFFHWTQIDSGKWFLIVVPGDGTYKVFDADTGNVITLTNDTGQSYLTAPPGKAKEHFFAVGIDDKVYIVNRMIQTQLNAASTAGTLTGTAQTLQDGALDSTVDGDIYLILGDENNDYDQYYAKKVGGKWYEWVKPGIQYQINAATMPHVITISADGTSADYAAETWGEREVGDTDSNEAPSFLGFGIQSLFFINDRLGIISGQNFVCSETGEYTNFWRTTVTQMLDSDRIDHKVNAFEFSKLSFAETVGKSLVMFADGRQFSVDGAPVFSPNTLAVNPITSFPASPHVRPVSAGPNVYFISDNGDFSSLREMFIQDETLTTDAANVSSHVDHYVPSNVRVMEVHPQMDQVLLASPDEPGVIYSYQYYWQGNEKSLSAWNKWEIAGAPQIVSLQAIDSAFHAVYTYNGATFYGKFDLQRGSIHNGLTHKIHLDHLIKVTAVYNGTEGRTYFTSPFPIMTESEPGVLAFSPYLVRGEGWASPSTYERPDVTWPWTRITDYQFTLPGDWTGTGTEEWWLGLGYDSWFRFSEQFLNENNRNQLHVRVQLRSMTIHFTNTGFFTTRIKVRGHDWEESEIVPMLSDSYTSRTVGDEYFQLTRPQLVAGTYQFPVFSRASDVLIEVSNPSPLPSNFQAAEWKALISRRTPR